MSQVEKISLQRQLLDAQLQSTDSNGALSEVSVGIDKKFELAEHSDQPVCKIPVNDSERLVAVPFVSVEGTLLLTSRQRPPFGYGQVQLHKG